MFSFSQRSLNNLEGVHPDLVRVCHRALELTTVDFGITEGLRSYNRQKELVAAGKSQTMHSRHLSGKAVDYAAFLSGGVTWHESYYHQIAAAFKAAAAELGIPIVWGGDWVSFKDLDHVELERHAYPDEPVIA